MKRRFENAPATRVMNAAISAAKGASWMSIVAATALGLSEVQEVRATVSAAGDVTDGNYRLVVQSYSAESLANGVPSDDARPRAATQRAVTAEELKHGVRVSMVDLAGAAPEGAVVVAWIEEGQANLEFDGLRARPSDGAYFGLAQQNDDVRLDIVVERRG